MSVPSNVENSDFPHKYFTDTSTYLWPIFLIKLADNFFTVSSFFHKTRITFFHQKGLGGIMTWLMIDIQVLPISRLRLKCSFMSETYLCSYIKIINKMITAEQPKINNIFPFLEWNILIFFGIILDWKNICNNWYSQQSKRSKHNKDIKSFVFTKKCPDSVGNH